MKLETFSTWKTFLGEAGFLFKNDKNTMDFALLNIFRALNFRMKLGANKT